MLLSKINIYAKGMSILIYFLMMFLSSCSTESGIQPFQDNNSQDIAEWRIFLKPLLVIDHSSDYITMRKPDFTTETNSLAGVSAYIGLDEVDSINYPGIDPISAEGMEVTNYLSYKMDVSYSDFIFDELKPNVNYKVIVVARNTNYYSVRMAKQRTDSTIPELNDIEIVAASDTFITIREPSFKTVIVPAPTVNVYIGQYLGTITVGGEYDFDLPMTASGDSYPAITGFLAPERINVNTGDPEGIISFNSSLEATTNYRIIVIAYNDKGYHIVGKDQSTADTPPELESPIILNNYTLNSLTLGKPALEIFGNPTPVITAYLGEDITVSNCVINSGTVIESKNVDSAGYEFTGLIENHTYTVIVIADNTDGVGACHSIQGTEKIDGTPPTLLSFYIETWESSSITISQPLFDDPPAVPEANLTGYVGYNGTINVSGNDTSGYTVTGVLDTIDILAGEKTFTGLSPNNIYKIYVVAENQAGSSVIDTLWSL